MKELYPAHHLRLAFIMPGILYPEKSPAQVDAKEALETYKVNVCAPPPFKKKERRKTNPPPSDPRPPPHPKTFLPPTPPSLPPPHPHPQPPKPRHLDQPLRARRFHLRQHLRRVVHLPVLQSGTKPGDEDIRYPSAAHSGG